MTRAQRIQEAIGYQSCAVVEAINEDLKEAIGAGLLPSADVLVIVGEAQFGKFKRRSTFCGIARKSYREGIKLIKTNKNL